MLDSRSEIVSKLEAEMNRATKKNSNPALFWRNTTLSQQQIQIAQGLVNNLNSLDSDQELLKNMHALMYDALTSSINSVKNFQGNRLSFISLSIYSSAELMKLKTLDYDELLDIKPSRYISCQPEVGNGLTGISSKGTELVMSLGDLLIDEIVKMKSSSNVELPSIMPTSKP